MEVRRVRDEQTGIRDGGALQALDDGGSAGVEPLPIGCRARSGGSQTCSTHCSKARVSGTARPYPATPCSSRSTRVTASGKAR